MPWMPWSSRFCTNEKKNQLAHAAVKHWSCFDKSRVYNKLVAKGFSFRRTTKSRRANQTNISRVVF
jgi:hypothetical protein